MELIAGIDGGGSKTVALLATVDGQILGRGTAGPCNLQAVPEEEVRQALHDTLEGAFAAAGLPVQPVALLGMGLSGVDRPADLATVQRLVQEEEMAHIALIVNDSQLLLWCGALTGWGLGLISGTGSIAFGRASTGRTARAGGWGYRFGDEGSGFAIGTAALRAISQAADGRGPQTQLTPLILTHWGLETPGDLIPYVYSNELPYPQVASLAEVVQVTADQGDAVAQAILEDAAGELARALAAVQAQLLLPEPIPTVLGGGVLLNCHTVRHGLLRACEDRGLRFSPLELADDPVQGALRMTLAAWQGA